jgi:hypothetical protein
MLVLCILQVSFLLVWFLSATKVIALAIAAWTKHNMLQQHQQPGQLLGILCTGSDYCSCTQDLQLSNRGQYQPCCSVALQQNYSGNSDCAGHSIFSS